MRGFPDYNNPGYQIAVQEGDFSLLSAIQGGHSLLDSRGRLVWYENFMNGLNRWNRQGANGGIEPIHVYQEDTSYGFYGSVLLDPIDNDGQSLMFFENIIPFGKRIGIEVLLKPITNHGKIAIRCYANRDDGDGFQSITRLTHSSDAITVEAVGGEQIVYNPLSGTVISGKWLNIKTIADYSIGKYYRMVIGGHELDLSSISMPVVTTQIKGRMYVDIRIDGQSGLNVEPCYLGMVAITTDEP